MLLFLAPAQAFAPPTFEGELAAQAEVEDALRVSFAATMAHGAWPPGSRPAVQGHLDRALAGGTTREQAWAYRWLRAWLRREAPPEPSMVRVPEPEAWVKEAATAEQILTEAYSPSWRVR